ncbi:MAG: AAA family ATPase [Proteobacteria bacterium]|nr:AAA family ATPase [Pseudomonadota bacterium]
MWIKQIAIHGFGKLKIHELNLKNDLNIIHGPNEAGKTSLACFIMNALSEPGEELTRYEPWEYSEFGGKIIYDTEALEIDFFNRNYTPPFKRKLLESIGYLFENEKFDINDGVDGTVVATLKRKMEETDTGRVLSLTIDRIDNLISEIPAQISVTSEELSALEKEIDKNKTKISDYNRIFKRKKELNEKIHKKEAELSEHEKIYEKETAGYIYDIKQKISDMDNELVGYQSKYEDLKWVETKSKEGLSRVIHLDNKVKELKGLSENTSTISKDLKGKKGKLNTRLNETFSILKINSAEELEKVYLKIKNIAFLKKMLNQKGKIREEYTEPVPSNPLWEFYSKNPNVLEDVDSADKNTQKIKEKLGKEIETVQSKLNSINPRFVTSKIFAFIFLLVTAATLVARIVYSIPNNALYMVAGISFLCAIFSVILWITSGKERNKAIQMMLDMEEYSAKNAWYNTPEIWQTLNKYGISTTTELRKSYIEYVNQASKAKDKSSDLSHIRQIEEELENTLKEFHINNDYQISIDSSIEFIEKSYSEAQELLASMISMDEQLKNHEANMFNYDNEIKKVQIELSETLIKLGMNMAEVNSFEETLSLYQDTKLKCSELSNEINHLKNKIELKYIPEKLNIFNRNVKNAKRDLMDLSEDLSSVSEKLDQIKIDSAHIILLHEKRDAQLRKLETLKATPKRLSTIKDLSKKQLNSYIGNYGKQFKDEFTKTFNKIVDRKVPVSIEDNLTIRLPINGRLENPETNLSKSTYDQMLFSYKLSLYKTLADINIPLIIDNAFMNYDDARLKNTMEIIAQESKTRQIIILSSDKRLKDAYSDHLIHFEKILN